MLGSEAARATAQAAQVTHNSPDRNWVRLVAPNSAGVSELHVQLRVCFTETRRSTSGEHFLKEHSAPSGLPNIVSSPPPSNCSERKGGV